MHVFSSIMWYNKAGKWNVSGRFAIDGLQSISWDLQDIDHVGGKHAPNTITGNEILLLVFLQHGISQDL
jgi:hypothetical protein